MCRDSRCIIIKQVVDVIVAAVVTAEDVRKTVEEDGGGEGYLSSCKLDRYRHGLGTKE